MKGAYWMVASYLRNYNICCYIYKTAMNMDYVNVCVYMNLKKVESMILYRVWKNLNL